MVREAGVTEMRTAKTEMGKRGNEVMRKLGDLGIGKFSSFPVSISPRFPISVFAALTLFAVPCVSAAPAHVIDLEAKGTPIHPGVRGLALADNVITRSGYRVGIPDCLAVSDGSALRGVAGGLYADLYDWRTRNNEARPPTLQFLRWARDHHDDLYITVNTRGVVEPDPAHPGKTRYTDTSIPMLANMAADWVRYTNRIARKYHQSDAIKDPRDRAILESLKWSSPASGDAFDTLPSRGERALPRVTYWEIGNEPTVSLRGGIGVSNGTKLMPEEYYARYKAIVTAMKREDPRIKVGPCITNGRLSKAWLDLIFRDRSLPVDFVSYHPYQRLGVQKTPARMAKYLAGVYAGQKAYHDDIVEMLKAAGRNPAKVEMVASEWFVSNWPYNETPVEGGMAHALGSVETVFSFARLGLTAAHYWIWIAGVDDGTRFPVTLAWDALRDHLGDTLVDVCTTSRTRLYTTRDSRTGLTAIWGINFSPTKDASIALSIKGLKKPPPAVQWTLGAKEGITALTSANLSPRQAGGPKSEVAWTQHPVSVDPSGWSLNLPAATLSVVVFSEGTR